MTFLADIEAFAKQSMLQASTNTNLIAEDLMNKAVVNSPSPSNPGPYAEGVLANQWYPETGGTFSSSVTSEANPNGSGSLSRIRALMASQPFYQRDNVVTLTNNVSYAYRAEHLGWPKGDGDNGWKWSGRIGPYAMVAKSMAYVAGKYSV